MFRTGLTFTFAVLASAPSFAQRLPGGVVPTHYDLTVAPDLAAATFSGTEKEMVRVEKPTTPIVLSGAQITFDGVSITAGGRTQNAKVTADEAKEQATFT